MKNISISLGSGFAKPVLLLLFVLSEGRVLANGIYGNGIGADAMSMGGAEVAWAADPLSAMTANPAGLGFLPKAQIELGGEGASLQGNFSKPGSGGTLDSSFEALPEGGLDFPLKNTPITFGLSVAPQSSLLANWHYNDPPGGLGGTTTYGYQQDKSEILLLRSAVGVAWQINSQLSIGASAGLLYNDNQLVTPYIFQNLQPAIGQRGEDLAEPSDHRLWRGRHCGRTLSGDHQPAIWRFLSKRIHHQFKRRRYRATRTPNSTDAARTARVPL